MQDVELVFGIINVFTFVCAFIFILYTLVRKYEFSKFVWITLSLLTLDSCATGIAQLMLFNGHGKYCDYVLDIVYGSLSILMFYITVMTSFKANRILFDIH